MKNRQPWLKPLLISIFCFALCFGFFYLVRNYMIGVTPMYIGWLLRIPLYLGIYFFGKFIVVLYTVLFSKKNT
jgi:hypothetical protein